MGAAIVGLVGAVIGALIGLGASWLTARRAEHAQERAEQRQRRERRLEMLAELLILLRAADPLPLGLRVSDQNAREVFRDFADRWNLIRPALTAFALGDPDPQLRTLVRDLEFAVGASLLATTELVRRLHRAADLDGADDTASSRHADALRLHELVTAAVRGDQRV